jgi:hypothetical protein
MAHTSISQDRQTFRYRFLEGLIGYASIAFLFSLVLMGVFAPVVLSIFIIIYSFLMVLKTSMHGIYTIYTYKNLRRWESVNWQETIKSLSKSQVDGLKVLTDLKQKHIDTLDWGYRLGQDITNFQSIQGSKYADFNGVLHIPIFAVYNESSEVVTRSLKSIFDANYPLDKMVVFISQEGRMGEEFNSQIRSEIAQNKWLNTYNISESDLQIVYNDKHNQLQYSNPDWKSIKPNKKQLTIVFTQHPDGLVGEIKGKASNEDWGGRQASLFVHSSKRDPDLTILTSLDADSRVGDNFFQMLSYRFCLTPDRQQAGFQPLPIYTNNFFDAHIFPRLVTVNTSIWYMILSSLSDELGFFANYAVPLQVLRKIDFWNREVIAEDSLLYAKCLVTFKGKFRVLPFYGTFEGDAVVGDDPFETISNQYRQLQRWAWGGIEGFPYKFKHFFWTPEGKEIDIRDRIRHIRLEFLNHFFWSTSPLLFSVIVFIPALLSTTRFDGSAIQLNLWIFTQYFAWLSFIFLAISTYITLRYIAMRALRHNQPTWFSWLIVSIQFAIAPFIYLFWGPPALDVQLRGIFGKYLGYWVTPKK